jgi:hypothetical protein
MLWLRIHYLVEEISTWRAGEMERLAVNTRYLVGEHIVRQQWDTFQRSRGGGLLAHRVQAKTLADFRRRHPGFVRHWDPATFGSPWLQTISPRHRSVVPISTLKPGRFLRDCVPRSPWPSTGLGGCRTAARTCRYSCLDSKLIGLSMCRWRRPLRPAVCYGEHPCITPRLARRWPPPPRPGRPLTGTCCNWHSRCTNRVDHPPTG